MHKKILVYGEFWTRVWRRKDCEASVYPWASRPRHHPLLFFVKNYRYKLLVKCVSTEKWLTILRSCNFNRLSLRWTFFAYVRLFTKLFHSRQKIKPKKNRFAILVIVKYMLKRKQCPIKIETLKGGNAFPLLKIPKFSDLRKSKRLDRVFSYT